ncbi:DUF262 domain-containing protein [Siccirubricoccus deserti]
MTAETTFDATQDTLEALLKEIGRGRIQLPDFQRGWVWDDEHIRSVATSISRSFPIGAVMTLMTGGEVRFQPRLVEGVGLDGPPPTPERLILDGQQRLTSLFQALTLDRAIRTRDDKGREVERWYYVDIRKALGSAEDREQAVFSVPEDRRIKRDFGREIVLDLSTPEGEYANECFPCARSSTATVGSPAGCSTGATRRRRSSGSTASAATSSTPSRPTRCRSSMRRSASKEAVCRVFEKVNTGGVPLTAFELLTATYAADGFNLREDWYGVSRPGQRHPGRAARLAEAGRVLRAIENTDFLQAVSSSTPPPAARRGLGRARDQLHASGDPRSAPRGLPGPGRPR